MGGVVSGGESNDELIDNLVESKYIRSDEVEKVFRTIDRADYFPGEYLCDAWKDMAWKSGKVHISAPCIYSEALESFELKQGLSFLNIGSGTGYLSTLVGLLIGPFGTNHGVELYQDCVDYAQQKLSEFMIYNDNYDPLNFCAPKFVLGDGLLLNASYRQYDRVYCGAGANENIEAYLKSLVKVGGILIIPINDSLFKYKKVSESEWKMSSLLPVQFAPLIEGQEVVNTDPIIEIASQPYTLQELARYAVLRSLGDKPSPLIDELYIPKALKRYLKFYRDPTMPKPARKKKFRPQSSEDEVEDGENEGQIIAFQVVPPAGVV